VKTQANIKWLALSFLTSFCGLFVGTVGGFVYGVRSVQSTTTELASRQEFVCGTGLVFLPFFSAIVGMILGGALGLIPGLIVWFRKWPKAKSDFSAYYGS
jgi:hypothetical protein